MPSKNLRMVLHNSCLDILISVQASVQISNRGKSLNGMEGEHIFIHNTLSLLYILIFQASWLVMLSEVSH